MTTESRGSGPGLQRPRAQVRDLVVPSATLPRQWDGFVPQGCMTQSWL